jgi:pimeloyl-ACP methyl ester carboxylesterase
MKRSLYLLSLLMTIALLGSCHKERIDLGTDADDLFFVSHEGAQMPIRVRGNVASEVFILYVHGGPGDQALPLADANIVLPLQEKYAVAYWDQRNSGSAQGSTHQRQTIAQYGDDLLAVLKVLKARYGNQIAVFLYAHSWGGTVATSFFTQDTTNRHLVKGWICIDCAYSPKEIPPLSRDSVLTFSQRMIDQGIDTAEWSEIHEFCVQNEPVGLEKTLQLNGKAYAAIDLVKDVARPTVTIAPIYPSPASLIAQSINIGSYGNSSPPPSAINCTRLKPRPWPFGAVTILQSPPVWPIRSWPTLAPHNRRR